MKNLPTSIKDRLLKLSRSQGGDYQFLLERFAVGWHDLGEKQPGRGEQLRQKNRP